jgi:DNA-binding beta-propeller fold protein YncE
MASRAVWPLSSDGVRLSWLRACCAVAEGADVPLAHTAVGDTSSRCPPEVCVGAVLGDALRRVSVLGGREGMARSLGSVYGGSVTRFLGGGLQGVASRVIDTPGVESDYNGVALSRDGSTLLVSDCYGGSHGIHVFSVADGSLRSVIGTQGDGPLQFHYPRQVWIASDGFVFVTECYNNRVQVLTPGLDFHGYAGAESFSTPAGVCANADIVVVSESGSDSIVVFKRSDGAVDRRFGSLGRGAGELDCPLGLCFMSGDRIIAVADCLNDRVSVFSVGGDFVRHVGVRVLSRPHGVACSAFDELVVADTDNRRVVVFDTSGEVAKTVDCGCCIGVAVRGSTVFALDSASRQCVVFT